jgi:hypothetical protein
MRPSVCLQAVATEAPQYLHGFAAKAHAQASRDYRKFT